MAKKDATNGITVPPEDTAVAVLDAPTTALAEYAANDTRGKESFDQSDLEIPRIAIAQKTSPEIEEGHAKQIRGLKFGDLFNKLTGESYGRGPVPFVVVRHMKNAVIFDPKTMKVVERNVPLNDPRTQFVDHPDGTTSKPVATVFHNYLVLLTDTLEPALLQLKSTQMKTAKRLNSLLKIVRGPIWCATFNLASNVEQFSGGAAGVYVFTPAGKTAADVAMAAENLYDNMAAFNAEKLVEGQEKEAQTETDPDSIPF